MSLPLMNALYAQAATASKNAPKGYTEEYYYKVKWGYADEFLALFKKNHYPILLKQQALGRILSIRVEAPDFHSVEEGRWDYRVTVTWKDRLTPFDNFDGKALIQELYPDQPTFKAEEKRRFELLIAHWDVAVSEINL
jgi:hypothetical protein